MKILFLTDDFLLLVIVLLPRLQKDFKSKAGCFGSGAYVHFFIPTCISQQKGAFRAALLHSTELLLVQQLEPMGLPTRTEAAEQEAFVSFRHQYCSAPCVLCIFSLIFRLP